MRIRVYKDGPARTHRSPISANTQNRSPIPIPCCFLCSPTAAGVCDTFESGVWEPTINKRNSLRSATEAACLILSIDETVKNPQVRQVSPSQVRSRLDSARVSSFLVVSILFLTLSRSDQIRSLL